VKIIELENVSFCYGNTRADFCLSDINIKIDKNEFVSIIGANGCGKSTLIKIAAGLLKPISGKVRINNSEYENYSRIDLAKLIAYVPQLYYSVYPYSVFEVVMMGRNPHLNIFGYENKFDIELVNDVLEKVGLYNLKNKSINEISGGEAQRAYIARALVQKPKVILLDEPNSHLDIKNEIALFKLLSNLRKQEEISIAIVTHHINLAGYFSDKVVLIKNGKVLENGDPKDVFNKRNIEECFDLSDDINVIVNKDNNTINLMPC